MAITKAEQLDWCDITWAVLESKNYVTVKHGEARAYFETSDSIATDELTRLCFAHKRQLMTAALIAAKLTR